MKHVRLFESDFFIDDISNKKIINKKTKNIINRDDKYLNLSKNLNNEHPFLLAAEKGSSSIVKKYIKNGVDVNMVDSKGYTALMLSCMNKYISIVDLLINAGADVNVKSYNGRTALMVSSTTKIITLLLNSGADVNSQEIDGDVVLIQYLSYFSTSQDYIKMLELFLEYGADIGIENNFGDNLYTIVKDHINNYGSYKGDFMSGIIKYLDKKFPQYKKLWEIKNDTEKYNL